MLSYLTIYIAAIVEGEIYTARCAQTLSAVACCGRPCWSAARSAERPGISCGSIFSAGASTGSIAFPRLGKYRDSVIAHVHAHETALVLVSRFLPGLRTAIPIACAYAGMRAVKFSTLNLISAFAWAGAIMAFVKGGSSTLSAFGLDVWWGPFIPAVMIVLFFRWLSRPSKNV